jgi:hypothetical protein
MEQNSSFIFDSGFPEKAEERREQLLKFTELNLRWLMGDRYIFVIKKCLNCLNDGMIGSLYN